MDIKQILRGERDPAAPHARLGIVGTALLLAITILSLASGPVIALLTGRSYIAEFAEAGGIASGDKVIVSGFPVGQVSDVSLNGDRVDVSFVVSDGSVRLGDQTRAAISTQTALGRKALTLLPAGRTELRAGDRIPLDRTTPPYDITEALSSLTKTVSDIDTNRLGRALTESGEFLSTAAPNARGALEGVQRLSDTLNARDAALSELLSHSANVSGMLADRDQQIQKLVADGSTLLSALNGRSNDIEDLLTNATRVSRELTGVAHDNSQQIGPALDQLNDVLELLHHNKANVEHAANSGTILLRELGDAVASVPALSVALSNLVATNMVPTLPELFMGGGK
ncbi:MAG: phospholipid/cholesterol/gamma-HCH transport system substrate-binding protein [Thermoanaerobaculia bacterium]|nr:phospholipid/cholesterol/gamma-HCH transport system substrate-binding protein [Thermoanaerobaculia bacterium]